MCLYGISTEVWPLLFAGEPISYLFKAACGEVEKHGGGFVDELIGQGVVGQRHVILACMKGAAKLKTDGDTESPVGICIGDACSKVRIDFDCRPWAAFRPSRVAQPAQIASIARLVRPHGCSGLWTRGAHGARNTKQGKEIGGDRRRVVWWSGAGWGGREERKAREVWGALAGWDGSKTPTDGRGHIGRNIGTKRRTKRRKRFATLLVVKLGVRQGFADDRGVAGSDTE